MARLGRSSFEQARQPQDLAVPWEEKLPPEKRRFDVRFIRGGPGKSGMGIVYLAYDRELKEPFAIKTFQDRFLGSPHAVENFKKEAQVWVELGKHKNIVKAVAVQVFLGRPYIFLEMVAGDELYGADLSGWIRGKGLDLSLMINFAIQFCRGMSHAEQRFKEMGRVFVHRDIKPENIMVTRDKVVKVTDFGLVHAVRDEAFDPESIGDDVYGRFSVVSQHGICGTPFYMSPEQVLQGTDLLKQLGIVNTTPEVPPLDFRSDMYAFGCVLYEMVTGQPPFRKFPFDRHDYPRYFYQTLYEEPVSVASGDRAFDELIMRLLRKAPEERGYRSFAELEEVLQGIHARLTGERLKEERIEEIEAGELVNRGVSFDSLGQFERAIADFEKALMLNPGLVVAYNNRGNTYAHLGQVERALADFEKVLTLNPGYAMAYNNRGLVYVDLGQFERAIADFEKALMLNPRDAEAYNNRGSAYVDLGQVKRALADFEKALTLNPGYAAAYANRGLAYDQLGQVERALVDFEKALTLNPRDAVAYNNRGNAYKHLGQVKRALADFEKAIMLNPGYAAAYYNCGNIYYDLGQFELAISEYDQALTLNPRYAVAYTNRGNAYYQLGQFELAIVEYNQALTLNPRCADAYANRGNAYAALGQFEGAIAEYDQALTLNPGCADAYYNRGLAYNRLGQSEQAIEDFRRFIEFAPPQYAQHIIVVKEWIRQLEAQIRRGRKNGASD